MAVFMSILHRGYIATCLIIKLKCYHEKHTTSVHYFSYEKTTKDIILKIPTFLNTSSAISVVFLLIIKKVLNLFIVTKAHR